MVQGVKTERDRGEMTTMESGFEEPFIGLASVAESKKDAREFILGASLCVLLAATVLIVGAVVGGYVANALGFHWTSGAVFGAIIAIYLAVVALEQMVKRR